MQDISTPLIDDEENFIGSQTSASRPRFLASSTIRAL